MIIAGINAYHGDAATVLVADGKLVSAVEEERFNRIRHSAGLPLHSFKAALKQTSLSPSFVDYLTIARDPKANLFSKLKFVLTHRPSTSFLKYRLNVSATSERILKRPDLFLGKDGKWHAKGIRVEHHLSHAASAFYPSGFDQSAILTVDGFGDFSSVMMGIGEGNRIRLLKRILFPHSLGILYTAATQFIGFPQYGDEYKLMGLAGWGEPRFVKEFEELIRLEEDGNFKLNLDYFLHASGWVDMTWSEGEPVLSRAYSDKWKKLFGEPRKPEDPLTQRDKDLAASVQTVYEKAFFHLLSTLYLKTGMRTLCLAGGCAFNSVANGKIFDRTPFDKVYIQPAAGDAGTALGSALYMYHHRLNQPRNFVMEHAYWGPEFDEKEIKEALSDKRQALSEKNCREEVILNESELCRKTAQAIADGKIVGWFQGRMEWGPRALGNRSILADPRKAQMKDILNERVKHREGFRPFAPSVLEESAGDWFEMKTKHSPFMNLVFPVRSEKKNQIPAVTHVDGTARVQTVSKVSNPIFWNLIHEFGKISGVPMLLNTSFNENEPIVCTPKDAINCFLKTKIDILMLGHVVIARRGAIPILEKNIMDGIERRTSK